MEHITSTQTNRVGKRGAWVIPAHLRHKYGLEEGALVIAEPRLDGILIKPAIASATLPSPLNQNKVWEDWFSLMSEVQATYAEIVDAKTLGRR